jgi:hypothetical protein
MGTVWGIDMAGLQLGQELPTEFKAAFNPLHSVGLQYYHVYLHV